jgi:hypothetical protein
MMMTSANPGGAAQCFEQEHQDHKASDPQRGWAGKDHQDQIGIGDRDIANGDHRRDGQNNIVDRDSRTLGPLPRGQGQEGQRHGEKQDACEILLRIEVQTKLALKRQSPSHSQQDKTGRKQVCHGFGKAHRDGWHQGTLGNFAQDRAASE